MTDFMSPPSAISDQVSRARGRGWTLGRLPPGCGFMLVMPADLAVYKRFVYPRSVFSWLRGLWLPKRLQGAGP